VLENQYLFQKIPLFVEKTAIPENGGNGYV